MKIKFTTLLFVFGMYVNTTTTANAQVNVQDSLALVDLYNSTDGQHWSRDDNWLTGPVNTWWGVIVTGTRVTYLDLRRLNLNGSLPSSLGNLDSLTHLVLSFNDIIGSLPPELENLTNLFRIDLARNEITGTIPSSFGNLINLKLLDFSYNQLSGEIPFSLGNLTNLWTLSLSGNLLSGTIPSSLGNLINLRKFYADNNTLSGSIPSFLGNLVNLESINLSFNQFTGSIPSSLGNLTNLFRLDLSYNRLSGSIPAELGNLSSNVFLILSNNRFTFDGMELIAQIFSHASYSPQARIPVHQHNNTLAVSAGGTLSNNTYKWFKIKKGGVTLVATIQGDSVFHPSENGIYFTRVFNSIATELILNSDTIHYAAASQDNKNIASSTNELQTSGKNNLFTVYPNPAKNILHVQTNGSASFSLITQAGKVLLTKNINGSETIDVANIASGLYYLKNNSTGAVQKVMIER